MTRIVKKSEKTVIFQFFAFFPKIWIFLAQIPPKQVKCTRIIIFKIFGPKKAEKIDIEHGGGVFTQF